MGGIIALPFVIRYAGTMTKVISALVFLLMAVQIIKPLGLPGLKKRGDFWKLALLAFLLFGVTALIRPE